MAVQSHSTSTSSPHATQPDLGRRALLGVTAAAPVALASKWAQAASGHHIDSATFPAATHSIGENYSAPQEAEILADAAEAARLRCLANACDISTPDERAEYRRLYDAWSRLADKVLAAPCVSPRVAAIKLRLGPIKSMEYGARADDLDAAATRQVIAYLEAL